MTTPQKALHDVIASPAQAFGEVSKNWHALYHAINRMMAVLGASGEISTRHPATCAVMSSLEAIDGGAYVHESGSSRDQFIAWASARGEIVLDCEGAFKFEGDNRFISPKTSAMWSAWEASRTAHGQHFAGLEAKYIEVIEKYSAAADRCHLLLDAKEYWRQRAEAAEAELARCRSDAERWRWWRKNAVWSDFIDGVVRWVGFVRMPAPSVSAGAFGDDSVARELDAAIDATLQRDRQL